MVPRGLQHRLMPTPSLPLTPAASQAWHLPTSLFPLACLTTSAQRHRAGQTKSLGTKGRVWGKFHRSHLGQISLVKMPMALLLRQFKFCKQIVKSISSLGCFFKMILTFSFSALCRNLLSLLLLTTARSAEFILQNSWAFSMETYSLLM